jgi:hypothetical protein
MSDTKRKRSITIDAPKVKLIRRNQLQIEAIELVRPLAKRCKELYKAVGPILQAMGPPGNLLTALHSLPPVAKLQLQSACTSFLLSTDGVTLEAVIAEAATFSSAMKQHKTTSEQAKKQLTTQRAAAKAQRAAAEASAKAQRRQSRHEALRAELLLPAGLPAVHLLCGLPSFVRDVQAWFDASSFDFYKTTNKNYSLFEKQRGQMIFVPDPRYMVRINTNGDSTIAAI